MLFVDTSALVKLYITEPGSERMQAAVALGNGQLPRLPQRHPFGFRASTTPCALRWPESGSLLIRRWSGKAIAMADRLLEFPRTATVAEVVGHPSFVQITASSWLRLGRTRLARRIPYAAVRFRGGRAARVACEVRALAIRVLNAGWMILEIAGILGDELRADRAARTTAARPLALGAVALEVCRAWGRASLIAGEVLALAVAVGDAARMVDKVIRI